MILLKVFYSILQTLKLTPEELALLAEAEKRSDTLVSIEQEAFRTKANQSLAISLLCSDKYLQAKAEIMRPIQKFMTMVGERTLKEKC